MTEALRTLGFELTVEPDPDEVCNRLITVQGQGGRIPRAGSTANPLDLFVGNAGTAARFLAALCCLGGGAYRLHGVPRMHERPQAALFAALRELGYDVVSPNDKLPALIVGRAREARGGTRSCTVSIEASSQFASALLLCSRRADWEIALVGENAEESPYVVMTQRMLEVFPWSGGRFQIEPDASSGSYVWAAGWWMTILEHHQGSIRQGGWRGSPVTVTHWPESGWQIDAEFPDFLPLPATVSRAHQLADSIMTAIVLAADHELGQAWAWGESPAHIQFTDLGRLRVQECERVAALRTELTKCGAKVVEEGDTLTVYPSQLHGAEIATYHDHRMAMCFAILGLKVPGIRLQNPACVKKTFPNFFQKLAAPPPGGLGAAILDARTGRRLEVKELFAE
jgi:3-phosphoshikimate 1-carboxyvinyltransferase